MIDKVLGSKKQYLSQALIWFVLLIASLIMMPDISNLVRENGGTRLPSTVTSQVADRIQNGWGKKQSNTRQIDVVFSNHNHKLTAAQNRQIKQTISKLKEHQKYYSIKSMLTAEDNSAAKKQLLSKDKTTQLIQLSVSKKETVSQVESKLQNAIKTPGVSSYLTGGDILNNDFTTQTEEGIKKTEGIAIVFILIVLILIFRSPVVPFVSLLSVGVSFLISLSLVMNLVKDANFPVSNFTQVFMVIVMFGIGTDYNILLFDQFKEELSHGLSPLAATRNALKIAGRTILFSGSSVLIGFATLGLANFSVYRSAVGVAVGVAVLLVVILTLNPFFMAILGKKAFWPSSDFSGGARSKTWQSLAHNSILHPLLSLLVTLIVLIPFAATSQNQLNYDTTAELDSSLPSMIGFRTVQKHFSKGTAEPTTIYIKSNHRLDNEKSMKEIDQVTNQLKQVKGVGKVLSVTQPSGTKVKKLYVNNQMSSVTSGLAEAQDGLNKVESGLKKGKEKIDATNINGGVQDAQKLATGSEKLASGLAEYNEGINKATGGTTTLKNGLYSYTSGVTKINNGLQTLNGSTGTLANGVSTLANGSNSLTNGLNTYTNGVGTLSTGLNQLSSNSSSLNLGINKLAQSTSQLPTAAAGFYVLNSTLAADIGTINSNLQQSSGSIQKMSSFISNNQSSIQSLTALGNQANSINNELNQMESLLTQINTAKSSLSSLNTDLSKLGENSVEIQQLAKSISDSDSNLNSDEKAKLEKIQNLAGTSGGNLALLNNLKSSLSPLISTLDGIDTTKLTGQMKNMSQLLGQLSSLSGSLNDLKSNDITSELAQYELLVKKMPAIYSLASETASKAATFNNVVNSSSPAIDSSRMTSSANIQNEINNIAGNSTLSSQVSKLVNGINSYTAGADQAAAGANKLSGNSQALNSGAAQMANGLSTLNGKVPSLVSGVSQLASGSRQLTSNNSQLNNGANQLSSAMALLNSSTGTLVNGSQQVASGNQQMAGSLASLGSQVGTLSNGLGTAATGLDKLNSGTGDMKSYLTKLKASSAAKTFYIPKKSIHGKQFNQSLGTYLSDDRKSAQIIVILNEDPASRAAMNKVDQIKNEVNNNLKGTALKNSTVALGGQTSFTNDVQKTASSDFVRTAIIMVVGILIALMLITRSILQPFYIIGTLVLAYAASLSLTRLLGKYILNQPMLTWNTPFFTFIMLIALGVDYSIFLMMKYRSPEFKDQIPSTRIVEAAALIGAVVLSAAVILCGTFAALIPSGILTLIQVALGVIIGLIILVIIIPIIIPSAIKLTYPLLDKLHEHDQS
ncbi:MMPL family transporter [Liquorilactobacillus ghanensis]|uniref:MMPL family transporter n=1 Tax=Liquorilactobacillus ghanensis TaxID=399370 RepID=UPI0039EBC3A9